MPEPTQAQLTDFRRKLARGAPPSALEGNAEAPLGRDDIRARTEKSREALLKFVESYYGPDERRKEIVERIAREGGEGLRMLADNDAPRLGANPQALEGLEAIIRTDGSRPSFLVRDGGIDRASSPVGGWSDVLTRRDTQLRAAIASVGRLDVPGTALGYQGTGFLVAPNLILTNRHVLQVIASPRDDGSWQLFPDVAIDFGREHQARDSVNRRKLKRVVFAGARPIDPYSLDHTKLDLALIELEQPAHAEQVPFALTADPAELLAPGKTVFTVGYPGNPPAFVYPPTLLDQLFQVTYGHKRLAPGEVIAAQNGGSAAWTVSHDATTLGGNSGSVVVALDGEGLAAGLHYGGRASAPAENWGHRLERVFGETDGHSRETLYEVLTRHGVAVRGAAPPRPESAAAAQPPAAPGNWRDGVTLKMMRPLAAGRRLERLEAAGDGETSAAELASRTGYDPNFIPGFRVPLPTARRDMRELRRGGRGVELKYEHFSVIMSASRRLPMVTACNLNGAESRSLPRISQWSYDGRLDRADQWGNELYLHNDVDRGHMVRREDPVWGTPAVAKRANIDTFHYTNSCPQMAGVNQRTWLGLEDYILDHVREDDMRVSVFTGPFFTADDLPYRGALVPKSFWKVVAFVLPDGRPSATAYRVSQARELQDLEFVFAGYRTFQISVQQVQDGTGVDFSALIPFDGFSQHERVHGTTLTEPIDRPEDVRV